MRGHGLVLDTKHAPGASGTIRMGVAAPHSGATALVWTKQGGGRVHERHPNPSIRPLGDSNPGLTNPNVRGHGLVLDIKHAPGASGTIRMDIAAPQRSVQVYRRVWVTTLRMNQRDPF